MKWTVLLVDDDQNLLEGLVRALRREPWQLLKANSAAEALAILATKPVDAVVSDQEMPGRSGTALLAEVRERYPETIRFMLTGKATLESAVQAINDGGIARFFMKPCNPTDLAASIRQGLQQKELYDAARKLLRQGKNQAALLKKLEEEYPQISQVERDDDGAIVLEDFGGDFDQLIGEIYAHLGEE